MGLSIALVFVDLSHRRVLPSHIAMSTQVFIPAPQGQALLPHNPAPEDRNMANEIESYSTVLLGREEIRCEALRATSSLSGWPIPSFLFHCATCVSWWGSQAGSGAGAAATRELQQHRNKGPRAQSLFGLRIGVVPRAGAAQNLHPITPRCSILLEAMTTSFNGSE